MSDTQPKPRPWHGHANPMDALHDWMVKELAALEQRLRNPMPVAPAPAAQTIAVPVAHPVPPVVPAPKTADV